MMSGESWSRRRGLKQDAPVSNTNGQWQPSGFGINNNNNNNNKEFCGEQ